MIGVKILEERKSPFNGKIQVIKSLGLGTYIQAVGITQSGGIVKEIWEKTLKKISHYPLTINHCLILGLGGGTAAKLVGQFWPKAKIAGVDIDPIMVELGRKYLGLDKVQVEVHVQDALKFINNYPLSAVRYDLVIVDLYIGDKFPKKFESEKFLRLISRLITNKGIVVFNRLYFGDKRPQAVKFGQKLQKVFPKVDVFYPEANIMYICRHQVDTKDNS